MLFTHLMSVDNLHLHLFLSLQIHLYTLGGAVCKRYICSSLLGS